MTVRWGTSTWTYPGWQGIVYRDVAGYGKTFARRSLGEYAASGRFGCVGIDSTFYGPPTPPTVAEWAEQLPAGFPCIVKVWQGITSPQPYARGRRDESGEPNPHLLDPQAFNEHFLPPFAESFEGHLGAFVLEFQTMPKEVMGQREFLERLDRFLDGVATGWRFAVELRSRWWLGDAYFDVLARHGAAHCFNVWTRMPLPHEVVERHPRSLACAPFTVCRALVRPGLRYADAVKRFKPYDRLQERLPAVRASLRAWAAAVERQNIDALVAVNNRLEGCAPITIEEIQRELGGELGADFAGESALSRGPEPRGQAPGQPRLRRPKGVRQLDLFAADSED